MFFFFVLFFWCVGGVLFYLSFKVCVYLSLRKGYVQWAQDAKDARGPYFPGNGAAEGCPRADKSAGTEI